jgi:hypothetical protein
MLHKLICKSTLLYLTTLSSVPCEAFSLGDKRSTATLVRLWL